MAGDTSIEHLGDDQANRTVYDRFVTYEGAATLAMFGCPEGVEYGDKYERCPRNCITPDVVDFLEDGAGRDSVGRITAAIVGVAPDERPR